MLALNWFFKSFYIKANSAKNIIKRTYDKQVLMKLTRILSDRHYQTWPSWHIVYEWENEISKCLNLPIINSPIKKNRDTYNFLYRKFISIDNKIFKGKINELLYETVNYTLELSLYFEMHPTLRENFSNNKKTIPVIVDFWGKSNIESFKKIYRKCPYLLITSLEVLNFLKENHIGNKLLHFPMSLPSIYKLEPDMLFEKKYDIILAGRTNSVLWNYLKQYEVQHPEIEYLHQIQKNGEIYYTSNKSGIIGKVQTRKEYINLIRKGRVSFYATPGIDGGEKRTNGFNPVTPRFFELLSAGCHIIARYPKNIETDYYQLGSICPSINSYDAFHDQLNTALKSIQPIKKNSQYLLEHYTSTRIEILNDIK